MSEKILEGSRAVAEAVNLCKPDVVPAYPITPQTHIVEDLAQFKADGKADFEYVRAESEFAAASIVLGASAAGTRVYTATSSQGLLLMAEVIYNIAGMRLPVVLTCANRAVSAPINIWNDHQDAMAVRDAGWIMLFGENVQEIVDMHIMAFKIAETAKLPVMVNMDGFILTHTYEPAEIPSANFVKRFLGAYKPLKGQFLDVNNPCTLGAFASPADYQGIREELQSDLVESGEVINKIYKEFQILNFKFQKKSKYQISNIKYSTSPQSPIRTAAGYDNGLIEYAGDKNAEVVIVAMGSVVGTIKHTVQKMCSLGNMPHTPLKRGTVGILKIKTFRPFPSEEVAKVLKNANYVAVLEKAISLGNEGILAGEIKQALYGTGIKVKSYINGLGGRDITVDNVKFVIKDVCRKDEKVMFL
ncbi:MAG: pyruvate ferredoxin oxidoreductase [bacterium]